LVNLRHTRLTSIALVAQIILIGSCTWTGPRRESPAPETATPIVLDTRGQVPSAQAKAEVTDATQAARDREHAQALVTSIQSVTRTPLVTGNRVRLLIDGPRTYAAMLAAIEQAHDHVHIETYIFADDEVGARFSDALIRKSEQGVKVRIIYDAVGSLESSAAFFDTLARHGIETVAFRPLTPSKLWKVNSRDHRKLIIVDGAVAFTGGINISDTYESASTSRPGPEAGVKKGWRDTHVEIRGPVVKQLQALFLETWTRLGEPADPATPGLYPQLVEAGDDLVQVVPSEGGNDQEFRIYEAYLTAIRKARDRIWISMAYFAPNRELREALAAAPARGVDVRIIVPGFTDSGAIYYASRATYAKLLEAGVQIYEHNEALMHAKTAVIDGVWSTVGSCNIDPRSFVHNNELNAVVVGGEFARSMQQMFRTDMENSDRIEPDAWKDRPTSERMKEFFSGLVSYWL
jgi:cardiolipin synthase